MRRLALAVLALGGLAGCGSSTGAPSGEVTSTVRRYFDAIAAGNGPEACALLSEREKLYLAEKHVSCPQAVSVAHSFAPSTFQRLRDVALSTPVVRGDVAVVHAFPFGKTRAIALLKVPGGWRIDTIDVFEAGPVASENRAGLEAQLAAHEVVAATIDRRTRTVHVTLRDSVQVSATYGRGELVAVEHALRHDGVPVTITSRP